MGIDAISDLGKVQLEIIASLDLTASVALQLFVLLDDFELGLYIGRNRKISCSMSGTFRCPNSAAQEFGRLNVRVNAVSLGLIYREGIEQEWPEGIARWTV